MILISKRSQILQSIHWAAATDLQHYMHLMGLMREPDYGTTLALAGE